MLYNTKKLILIIFLLLSRISISNAMQDTNNYSNLDNIFKSYQEIKDAQPIQTKQVYVFISFSMPDNLIKNYILEAQNLKNKKNIDIIFVLRGFYKNSFAETTKKMTAFTKDEANKLFLAVVDPTLFQKYDIQQVPIIVKKYEDETYDKISGSVSINYALQTFEDGGR